METCRVIGILVVAKCAKFQNGRLWKNSKFLKCLTAVDRIQFGEKTKGRTFRGKLGNYSNGHNLFGI